VLTVVCSTLAAVVGVGSLVRQGCFVCFVRRRTCFFFLTGAIGMSCCRAGGDEVPWFGDAWFVDGLRGGVVGVWGRWSGVFNILGGCIRYVSIEGVCIYGKGVYVLLAPLIYG
jgi:hypothetical protein